VVAPGKTFQVTSAEFHRRALGRNAL
jgi:hypothetical protein